jgi:hypothetical protein
MKGRRPGEDADFIKTDMGIYFRQEPARINPKAAIHRRLEYRGTPAF